MKKILLVFLSFCLIFSGSFSYTSSYDKSDKVIQRIDSKLERFYIKISAKTLKKQIKVYKKLKTKLDLLKNKYKTGIKAELVSYVYNEVKKKYSEVLGENKGLNEKKLLTEAYIKKYNNICRNIGNKTFNLKNNNLSFVKSISKPNKYGESSDLYYIKDKNYIYFFCKKINKADVKSFIILNFFFAKDDNYVYASNIYEGKINKMDNIDSKTFEILSDYFYKDKNNVYYFSDGYLHIAKEIDVNSFKLIDEKTGKDKKDCYGYSNLETIERIDCIL